MAFWKPGTAAPGLGVGAGTIDRETEGEASFMVAGNLAKSLSISQQRSLLPIAAHRTSALIPCDSARMPRCMGSVGQPLKPGVWVCGVQASKFCTWCKRVRWW